MNLYLIDYENVKNSGLNGVNRLDSGDKVVVFYSPNADTISFETHKILLESSCQIDFFKIKRGGKNSLDFQLSTYLGFMMSKGNFKNAVIISRDQGYDSLLDFWESGFAAVDTGLYRFVSIGAFLHYCTQISANNAKLPKAQVAAFETDSEEIPEPIEEAESAAFTAEVESKVVDAEAEQQKKTPAGAGHRGRPPRNKTVKPQAKEQVKEQAQAENMPHGVTEVEPKAKTKAKKEKQTANTKPVSLESAFFYEDILEQSENGETIKQPSAELLELLEKYPSSRQLELIDTIKTCQKKGDLYIRLMKNFGRKSGLEYYHELKGNFEKLKQLASEC